jgi:hypothetical protein
MAHGAEKGGWLMSKCNCPECSLSDGAADIAIQIVCEALRVGGDLRTAMILTERIAALVFTSAVKPEWDGSAFGSFSGNIRTLISEMRLAKAKAEGRA